jgi:primosomal protein N' (replication factor Y)
MMSPLPVIRLDADVAKVEEALRRFDAAPAGVLVGTQMVAKGHDFPDVTLGVVVDADSTLRFPDFRAEERTFALVAQLAGRSGRGSRGGRVIVQTADPSADCLRHAAAHDADTFLDEELARRRLLSYPPFATLIRVVCSSEHGGAELIAAEAVRERVEGVPVLGPAPLFRLKGRERAQLVIKAAERGPAVRAVRQAVEAVAAEHSRRGVNFTVDVDPQ